MKNRKINIYITLYLFLFLAAAGNAQDTLPAHRPDSVPARHIEIDYAAPAEYIIGGVTVNGLQYLDASAIITISGLEIGQKIKIPGDDVTKAIDKLWKYGMFENIKISAEKIIDTSVFLSITLSERPRLTNYKFIGIRKGEGDNLKDKISISKNDVVSSNAIIRITNSMRKYYIDKGYLNAKINIYTKPDVTANYVWLYIEVNKNKKVKIEHINFDGNTMVPSAKLKHALKNTKEKFHFNPLAGLSSYIVKFPSYLLKGPGLQSSLLKMGKHFSEHMNTNLFKASKFNEEDYKTDKQKIIETYNELGYRDAVILSDTIITDGDKNIDISFKINEGKKYFLRSVKYIGNTKYTSRDLDDLLKMKKGDVYNQKLLDQNLYMNVESGDISSLYLDNGYLFFNVSPVEINVENDSIDLEIRIYEGAQATVNRVTVKGNTRTNDHVILREIRTRPGALFNRSDIIRTQRELAQLRYFDQEKLTVNPKPNPADGTVDIDYGVEEVSSDQLELSGGWGAGRIIGTLGFSFNNFSTRNLMKKGAWTPLPSGDGQKLTIRAQTNGKYYQGYNASFTEPWLGGKKPTALTVSLYHTVQNFSGLPKSDPSRQSISINGVSVGIGKRIKWPDDFFNIYHSIGYQNYVLNNYYITPSFQNGRANNINYTLMISRNSSGDNFYYPTHGSDISLMFQTTPPFSLFSNKNYTDMSNQEKYRWLEFHKWKFKAAWYTTIIPKLVLSARSGFGFIGYYNKNIGLPPFGRFWLGGDGLTGYALDDREVIALRGYENNSLTPKDAKFQGGAIYNKYTMELRYPLSLNPMSTIYVLGFVEAGNAWLHFNQFNPFDVKRSAGVGFRIFLPMFGLLGVDWGYGFDMAPGATKISGPQFHFSIGQSME